jgi:two-component system OmpR family response regulator
MSLIQRVLVVEDDPGNRELLTRVFRVHNIKVVTAASGEEALNQVQHFSPNLIILDLVLPGIDGWTVLKHLRENTALSTIPIVAVTAFHTPELALEAIQVGFTAYFAKPLNVLTLMSELEQVMRN